MDIRGLHQHFGSFGYKVCLEYLPEHEDQPSDMREHIHMIGDGLGELWQQKATLDDVCLELELLGVGRAGTMRSVALARLGEDIEYQFYSGEVLADWLGHGDYKLGVWAACACAREALQYVPYGEQRPLVAIETAENWVRSNKTREEGERPAKEASDAAWEAGQEVMRGTEAPRYDALQFYWAARAASAAARAVYDKGGVLNAATSASEAYSIDVYDVMDIDEYRSKYKDGMTNLVSVIVRSLQSFPVVLSTR